MDTQKLKQDHGNVRWDGPRLTGIAPDFAPQEIDSPLFATNMTPSNADELVRRWNNHNDLLAALKALVQTIEYQAENNFLNEDADEGEENDLTRARAAIANATSTH